MIKKYYWIFLISGMIVAAFLRMYRLDSVPPHLGNDEISIAYDSYSIRVSGKDEYGIKMPLSFKSHRDYKAPLYAYMNMPFNYIFGNTENGVRMLSAVSGVVAVLLLGLLGRLLGGENLGIAAAFMLAINPKSIFVSRIGYESNLASTITLLVIYLMFLYKKKRVSLYLVWVGVLSGLSIWAYHTQKGLMPLLLTILPWLSRKEIKLKNWVIAWILMILVATPIAYDFLAVQSKDPFNRASSQIWFKSASMENYFASSQDIKIKKVGVLLTDPLYRYLDHFSFDFLFGNGLWLFAKYEPLSQGWFLLSTIILLIVGLASLRKTVGANLAWLLAWWLICPIVPSLTSGEVATVRNLAFVVPTCLIMGAGMVAVAQKSKLMAKMTLIVILLNFGVFVVAYFSHFPKISGDNFQYGYKQSYEFIKPMVGNYDKIVVEPNFGKYGQYVGLPRLYFGYFGAFDVETMQKREENSGRIGKYWIRSVDWNKEEIDDRSIYIVSIINPIVNQATDKLELIKTIDNPDGEAQFLIYRSK